MADFEGLSLISGALQTDIDAMCALTEMGWKDEPLWAEMMQNVVEEHKRGFLASLLSKRVGRPYNDYFQVVEKATG